MMRALFLVLIIANGVLYGVGAGWFGIPPTERGRDPNRAKSERNADKVQLAAPIAATIPVPAATSEH